MQQRPPSLQTTRIIAFAILAGPALFGIVVPIVRESMGESGNQIPMLGTVAAIASAAVIPTAFFLRRTVWSRAAGAGEQQKLTAFVQGTILFLALLEGAMLLDLVVWLITGEAIPAAIVAGLLWVIGLVNFPTQAQLSSI